MERKPRQKKSVDSIFHGFFGAKKERYKILAPYYSLDEVAFFATDKKTSSKLVLIDSEGSVDTFTTKRVYELTIPHDSFKSISFFQVLLREDKHHIYFAQAFEGKPHLFHFESPDLITWALVKRKRLTIDISNILPGFLFEDSELTFFGSSHIGLALCHGDDGLSIIDASLLTPREGTFDDTHIRVFGSWLIKEGILALYDSSDAGSGGIHSRIGAVILDKQNPRHILWRSDVPLWQEFKDESHSRSILGACFFSDRIVIYFQDNARGKISVVEIAYPFSKFRNSALEPEKVSGLSRHATNPLLNPLDRHGWEAEAVFNPAVWDDGENVHLVYRAIGNDGVSRLGYAKSFDGVTFGERLTYPIVELKSLRSKASGYDPMQFPSGGSWGGAEDPRMVGIDGKVYITMSAFDGWDFIRMAAISCDQDKFSAKNFSWSTPQFLSPPGEIHKNWVLFPEKINGKFAILHNVSPQVEIDYVDDLESLHNGTFKINSSFKPFSSRGAVWEKRMRGVGPPPVKTVYGWLVFYHAMDEAEPHRYKLGVMLLDLKNPTKVLYRSNNPILEPDADYENCGKPGVIYACGATVRDEHIYIYYGGADKVVCVASAPLKNFLHELMRKERPKLSSRPVKLT